MTTAMPAATEGTAMSQKIKVILNGCEERISEGATILDLIALLNETDRHLIVEHNNFLIPPSQYATRTVADGDIVEFINPNMGG
jgi:thiamine biosynthesis protein ThiS